MKITWLWVTRNHEEGRSGESCGCVQQGATCRKLAGAWTQKSGLSLSHRYWETREDFGLKNIMTEVEWLIEKQLFYRQRRCQPSSHVLLCCNLLMTYIPNAKPKHTCRKWSGNMRQENTVLNPQRTQSPCFTVLYTNQVSSSLSLSRVPWVWVCVSVYIHVCIFSRVYICIKLHFSCDLYKITQQS